MLACLDLLRNHAPPPTAPATLQTLGPEGSLSSCCQAAHHGLNGQNGLSIPEAEQPREIILRELAICAQCFDLRTDKPLRHWIFLDCSFFELQYARKPSEIKSAHNVLSGERNLSAIVCGYPSAMRSVAKRNRTQLP